MKRYLSVLFLTLFIQFKYLISTCKMSSNGIEQSSTTYLHLKDQRGHWHGQDHNPAIDNYDGERHQAMIQLQNHLGKTGTSSDEIQRLMGSPTSTLDKPDLVLNHEFSRADDPFTFPANAKIWVYEWRGNHDFVYFVISNENQVIRSGWYNAYE